MPAHMVKHDLIGRPIILTYHSLLSFLGRCKEFADLTELATSLISSFYLGLVSFEFVCLKIGTYYYLRQPKISEISVQGKRI